MTLHQCAIAARAEAKWILNSSSLLGRPVRRTPADSRWWGLVRLLTESLALPLQAAAEAATRSFGTRDRAATITVRTDPSQSASLQIDLPRYESVFLGNLSRALMLETPKRKGRPAPVHRGAVLLIRHATMEWTSDSSRPRSRARRRGVSRCWRPMPHSSAA